MDDDIYDHGKLKPQEDGLIMSDNMQGYREKNFPGIARNENAFPHSLLCVSYRPTDYLSYQFLALVLLLALGSVHCTAERRDQNYI